LVEHRAYPIRIGGAAGPTSAAATGGNACQAPPGLRPAGTGTSSSAVSYLEATFPPRVRHGDGAITLQFGQS
jgi:hypothetical protein